MLSSDSLLPTLSRHLREIVFSAIGHDPARHALVVFDENSTLSSLLAAGYRAVLPDADFLNFDQTTPDRIRAAIDALQARDLVVLVQSGSFRLNEFRFRLELFKRGLAVIEHPHLGRMPEAEHAAYVDSLAYDPSYYRTVGPSLKRLVDRASRIVVACEGTELVYDGPFEPAKLNVGDYRDLPNVGGQFPIGETFTEPADLSNVNGDVLLFAFGNGETRVEIPKKPIRVRIERGMIVDAVNPTPGFSAVLDRIRADEALWIRELGFGLNRALTRHQTLTDVGSYERMCGIHLSIGAKHSMYAKPGFPKRTSRYHVDVFADVSSVTIDDTVVFERGSYRVSEK